ncbi:uncharacterized protein N7479_006581 [Penicillium vulpinum]|uniref:Uncharacterized protein n=1 Tax=Penicillium vulpinum TaxID=29845 RepID=A0A1V6S283_9EURO|nr:uncharacterized protein N7479_006581 [Penicillium vulpinum]KAJ5959431.1 hypothetical protein N7479_006581 [Penicillium vulpinum]OQE07966.1 hypothetical protein PENVUL_c011G09024 [Penicillium vulpinum]
MDTATNPSSSSGKDNDTQAITNQSGSGVNIAPQTSINPVGSGAGTNPQTTINPLGSGVGTVPQTITNLPFRSGWALPSQTNNPFRAGGGIAPHIKIRFPPGWKSISQTSNSNSSPFGGAAAAITTSFREGRPDTFDPLEPEPEENPEGGPPEIPTHWYEDEDELAGLFGDDDSDDEESDDESLGDVTDEELLRPRYTEAYIRALEASLDEIIAMPTPGDEEQPREEAEAEEEEETADDPSHGDEDVEAGEA